MQITIPVSEEQLALMDGVASAQGRSREELLAEILASYLDTFTHAGDWLSPEEDSRLRSILSRHTDEKPEDMDEEEWVLRMCDQGMEDVRAGRTIPHDEAMARIYARIDSLAKTHR